MCILNVLIIHAEYRSTIKEKVVEYSGGSRISRRGAPTPEAATFRKICMSKRKNLDPWGRAPAAPPGSANGIAPVLLQPNGKPQVASDHVINQL